MQRLPDDIVRAVCSYFPSAVAYYFGRRVWRGFQCAAPRRRPDKLEVLAAAALVGEDGIISDFADREGGIPMVVYSLMAKAAARGGQQAILLTLPEPWGGWPPVILAAAGARQYKIVALLADCVSFAAGYVWPRSSMGQRHPTLSEAMHRRAEETVAWFDGQWPPIDVVGMATAAVVPKEFLASVICRGDPALLGTLLSKVSVTQLCNPAHAAYHWHGSKYDPIQMLVSMGDVGHVTTIADALGVWDFVFVHAIWAQNEKIAELAAAHGGADPEMLHYESLLGDGDPLGVVVASSMGATGCLREDMPVVTTANRLTLLTGTCRMPSRLGVHVDRFLVEGKYALAELKAAARYIYVPTLVEAAVKAPLLGPDFLLSLIAAHRRVLAVVNNEIARKAAA